MEPFSDRQAEAARIAAANEQAGQLSALEVDGFSHDDPRLHRLNGVYVRGAADFESYRPSWSKLLEDSSDSRDGFLFFHGADGWVFSDKPADETHRYLAAAAKDARHADGAIPVGAKTVWKLRNADGGVGGELVIRIVEHTEAQPLDVLTARAGRSEAAPGLAELFGGAEDDAAAAARIQAAHRGKATRRQLSAAAAAREAEAECASQERATVTLQSAQRSHATRRQLAVQRDAQSAAEAAAEAAAASAGGDQEYQDDDLVEHKFAVRLQSNIRGHCLRRRLRWQAEDLSSTAPLCAFLGKAGLGRLANYFLERGVLWEQLITLTPKQLGGHMFPHVDFKFTSPEAAALFQWKPENTSGRVPWGLPADERLRLGKALRAERVRIAGREKADEDKAAAAAKEAEAVMTKARRQNEIAEGASRAERKAKYEREETLKLLQGKQREEAAAKALAQKTKERVGRLQGGIAEQERGRRDAELARIKADREVEKRKDAEERKKQALAARRKGQLSCVKVGATLRVCEVDQLAKGLIAVGGKGTGRVALVDPEEKLTHAGKFGTVEGVDPSDDTVLLQLAVGGGVDGVAGTAGVRFEAIWFPIECVDTRAAEKHAADRAAAKAKATRLASRGRGGDDGGGGGGGALGLLQLPPLQAKLKDKHHVAHKKRRNSPRNASRFGGILDAPSRTAISGAQPGDKLSKVQALKALKGRPGRNAGGRGWAPRVLPAITME